MGTSQPVLRVIQGGPTEDRRAFLQELYTKYGGSVLGRCRYLLKDASKAEDAMHDVFARALTHSDGFRSEASPLTWLMKIATNHCLNQIRSERAGWRSWFQREEAAKPEGHGGPQSMETRDLVRRLLSRVDVETQAAVIHYHVDGMTLEEVAAALGRSVPTVRKRLESFAELGGEELRVR
ncbi:RNA polymerase sigma factor [Hyalangium minutum]|uniref:RNA polymerase, sigma-24 subunit, ECF subfamily protein n=1 Tax=Hyalangium minutum TaxID=394096 RepID=A0A085WHE8_9BACT|nr:sigma-70 family RNA polymerase sigma factor [Hyalangium minutum]KFE67111.1 RNA polymerase, sigma-24 subunit, ECF subfamily protein [Hyalangium minutum]